MAAGVRVGSGRYKVVGIQYRDRDQNSWEQDFWDGRKSGIGGRGKYIWKEREIHLATFPHWEGTKVVTLIEGGYVLEKRKKVYYTLLPTFPLQSTSCWYIPTLFSIDKCLAYILDWSSILIWQGGLAQIDILCGRQAGSGRPYHRIHIVL